MKLPIRHRLVLWTSGPTLALALVLAAFLHVRLGRYLEEDLDRYIEYELREFAEIVEEGCTQARFAEFTEHEIKTHPTNLKIYVELEADGVGTIYASSNLGDARLARGGGAGHPSGRLAEDLRLRLPGEGGTDERRVRLLTVPVTGEVTPHGRRAYRLEIAFDLDPVSRILESHRANIFTALVAMVLLAVSIGWLVASAAMRPVYDMIGRAERITAESLREARLPLPGTRDELDRLARVLNTMLERLDRSIRTVQRFTADAAHELRTPLTTIRGELELLQRRPEQFTPAALEPVLEEIGRLETLCRRLLLLARLDERAPSVERRATGLPQLLERLVDQVQPLADSRQVRLTMLAGPPARVEGNEDLLSQAFLNLLDNAIRHTPAGGAIAVACAVRDRAVTVEVRDTGSGIAAEHLPRIFDRFYRIRGREASEDGDGCGLGLAIAKEVVEFHGGRIEVESAVGRGTTFRIVLPTIPADESVLSHS